MPDQGGSPAPAPAPPLSHLRVRPRGALAGKGFEALFFSIMPALLVALALPPDLRASLGAPVAVVTALSALIRAARLELLVDRSGVLIKSFWRTTRLHWAQIEAVELTSVTGIGGYGSRPAIAFRTPRYAETAQTTAAVRLDERRELTDALRWFAAMHDVPCHLRVVDRQWLTTQG